MATKLSTRDSVPILKIRIQELEAQVADLKKRFDALRKAKNTTVLKRDREVLEVAAPFSKRHIRNGASDSHVADLERKLAEVELSREDLNQRLEDEKKKKQEIKEGSDCEHQALIEMLQTENIILTADNSELRERVESLYKDLSIKEAMWCQMEEKYKLKLEQSWGEKYSEWMAATERKIDELQHANNILREMLHHEKPDSPS